MVPPKSEYLSEVWRDGIFKNKVVFCTGGAGTVCSAQVRALVHLGADACIIGRNAEKTERVARDIAETRPGARVLGIGEVDVRNAGNLSDAATRCAKELGGIDYVIAGAAGNFLAPISQLSPNAFKAVIDIDVIGSYNTIKATLPYLQESASKCGTDGKTVPVNGTGGRVIFVSATFHYTGQPLQTHVTVAKAGVDALSAQVAIEQGPRGLTSNIIAPGGVQGTEGVKRLTKREHWELAGKMVPTGRWSTVKEIADATIYLFSDAGNQVNGEVLVVDGGAWRIPAFPMGQYPDFLLSDAVITGVKGMKKDKTKAKL